MKARDFKSRETGPDPWGNLERSQELSEEAASFPAAVVRRPSLWGLIRRSNNNHTGELAGQLSAIISWKLNSIKRNLKIKAKCCSCLRFKMNSEENWDILDEGHKVLWEKKKTLFQMWMLVTLTWHKCACSLTLLPDLPFLGLPRIQHSFFPSRCRGIFLPFSFWPSVCGFPGLTGC